MRETDPQPLLQGTSRQSRASPSRGPAGGKRFDSLPEQEREKGQQQRLAQLISFGSGLVFAVGLALSGMTKPDKVLGFLDITGQATGAWDPSLAFVMAGAVCVNALLFAWSRRRTVPVCGDRFPTLPSHGIDKKLVWGSALFGIGWGLAGYCPGPALVSIVTAGPSVLVFTAVMVASMWLTRGWLARVDARRVDARREDAEGLVSR